MFPLRIYPVYCIHSINLNCLFGSLQICRKSVSLWDLFLCFWWNVNFLSNSLPWTCLQCRRHEHSPCHLMILWLFLTVTMLWSSIHASCAVNQHILQCRFSALASRHWVSVCTRILWFQCKRYWICCLQVCMTKELTTLAPSEMEILVGVPRRVFHHCWRHTLPLRGSFQFLQLNQWQKRFLCAFYDTKWMVLIICYVTSHER